MKQKTVPTNMTNSFTEDPDITAKQERDRVCNELNKNLGLLRKMWTISEIVDFIKRLK